jgi:hypothetical protein
MMTTDEMEEEIETLKDQLESTQREVEELIDDKDRQAAEMESTLEAEKARLEAEFKAKLKAVNRDAKERMLVMEREVDRMRNAFAGDCSGWAMIINKKGEEVYENELTGEVREEMPEVMVIAEAMQRVQKADEYLEELTTLRKKYKQADMKAKEGVILVNKAKTEMNSLKTMDRQWKDAAKSVFLNMKRVGTAFDANFDQMMDSFTHFKNVNWRIEKNIPGVNRIKDYIEAKQIKMGEMEKEILDLSSRLRSTTAELLQAKDTISKLTTGMEEEVERLTKPMRERMTQAMVSTMLEKAARAQERRELADMWPPTTLMPTLLLKSRALTDEEQKRRVERALAINASKALSLEIRANVAESKKWEMKYDDYGRPFYEHLENGEITTVEPEILSYKPPPGRDESGNITVATEFATGWDIHTDSKGVVYYKERFTNKISYISPDAYPRIPPCKKELMVMGEAALLVLKFIKRKMQKHAILLKRRHDLHQLNMADKKEDEEAEAANKKEQAKSGGSKDGGDSVATSPEVLKAREERKRLRGKRDKEIEKAWRDAGEPEDDGEDLSMYLYDVDTVEYIAEQADPTKKGALLEDEKKPGEGEEDDEEGEKDPRDFVRALEVAKQFELEPYLGPTIESVDLMEITEKDCRKIVEHYAVIEDKVEKRLELTRRHLKDFSYLLMDAIRQRQIREKYEAEAAAAAAELEKKERRELRRQARQEARKARAEEDGVSLGDLSMEDSLATGSLAEMSALDGVKGLLDEGDEDVAAATEDKPEAGAEIGDDGAAGAAPKTEAKGADEDDDDKPDSGDDEKPDDGDDGEIGGLEDEDEVPEGLLEADGKPSILKQGSLTSEITGAELPDVAADDDFDAPVLGDVVDTKDPAMYEPHLKLQAERLGLFAVYCGFANLRLDNAPDDKNLVYAFQFPEAPKVVGEEEGKSGDVKGGKTEAGEDRTSNTNKVEKLDEDPEPEGLMTGGGLDGLGGQPSVGDLGEEVNRVKDDDWLTSSFFIVTTKDRVDAIREVTYSNNDDVLADLGLSHLRTVRLDRGVQKEERAYTNAVNAVDDPIRMRYQLWKSRQLFAEVTKFQLQNEAILGTYNARDANKGPEKRKLLSLLPPGPIQEEYVSELSVKRIKALGIPKDDWAEAPKQYVRISFATWTDRVESQLANTMAMRWENIDHMNILLHITRLQLDTMTVEVFDESNVKFDALVGTGTIMLHEALGAAMGRAVELEVKLKDHQGKGVGTTFVEIVVGAMTSREKQQYEGKAGSNLDPNNLVREEVNTVTSKTFEKSVELKLNEDSLSGIFPSLVQQRQTFANLVADIRGDVQGHAKMMTAAVTANDVMGKGYRPSPDSAKALPNFDAIKEFMRRKEEIIKLEIQTNEDEIVEHDDFIVSVLAQRLVDSTTAYNRTKAKYDTLLASAAGTRKEVDIVMAKVENVRAPKNQPVEPVKNMMDVFTLPSIPSTGGIDGKGKKKKKLKKEQMKIITDTLLEGKLDEGNWVDFFGDQWPDGGQTNKLKKAAENRNDAIKKMRLDQEIAYKLAMDTYDSDMIKFNNDDRKRLVDYQKVKKESRRVNLKLDCFTERANMVLSEVNSIDSDNDTWRYLANLHQQSKDRYKVLRTKQYMEYERHHNQVERMQKKLLDLVEARRRALDMPGGAQNAMQFEDLRTQSEAALRTLRYEVVDAKTALIDEGVRMRTMWDEANASCKSEHTRVRMLREVILQRNSLSQIISRHRYEVFHLYEGLEKLKLIEAERDDLGDRDTYDNIGERYLPDKRWESPEIVALLKQIAPIREKIVLTQGLITTTGQAQKAILENMANKWGTEYFQVRDSWIENSDYDRSQRLMYDVVQWLSVQREKLGMREKEIGLTRDELLAELQAAREETEIMVKTNDDETNCVTTSTSNAIKVVKDRLEVVRVDAKNKSEALEKSVTDLSREGQQLREHTLEQTLVFEDKITTLFSVISTLQATLSQMSGRMEIMQEERDRVVLRTKVAADKSKQQLRAERKHCSNLMMIVHSQRGTMMKLRDRMLEYKALAEATEKDSKERKAALRAEIWENVFCITRLATDVDELFEFFASRLANLAGSRKFLNDALHRNNAGVVFAALAKSPKPLIRKYAAQALAGMGWDSFVESRIIMWNTVSNWQMFQKKVLIRDKPEFDETLGRFQETGTYDAIISNHKDIEDEFEPSSNMSLRNLIKQRRQWAVRVTRRNEGPNKINQQLLNMRDGVIPTLLHLCETDGGIDWEIVRNAILAISVASLDEQNHFDMTNDDSCARMLVAMCGSDDAEIRTHASVALANLCHKDEQSQAIFGEWGAVPALLASCKLPAVDVLEAATAALSNLTCFCDANCKRIMEEKERGIPALLELVTRAYAENLFDLDQNDEVQANAVEILANVSRFNCEMTVDAFNNEVVDGIIVMCASDNKQVKRHAPLVIGNIAQNETCRKAVGDRGGVEALFIVLEDDDKAVQANTLWSLCNLMWYPPNQERAGRFLSEILLFVHSDWLPVRRYSCVLVANMLYYNNPNRVRFLETDGTMELLIEIIKENPEQIITEACLRSVLSLSYLDQVALWLGTDGGCIPLFLQLMYPPLVSRDALRYALEIIGNLCIHHVCRKVILDENGIDILVNLHSDVDPHIQEVSHQIIGHLEDITPEEVLAKQKLDIGLERMIQLASDTDPIVRAVAAESIGEEVWHNAAKQQVTNALGGVEALLSICLQQDEPIQSLLPALWSLRNLLHANPEAQEQFGGREGVRTTLDVLGQSLDGRYVDQSEKVVEACLSVLVNAIHHSDRNSRKVLRLGLEVIMDLADGKIAQSAGVDDHVREGAGSEGVVAMAKSILQMLGPYNYVVCRNCHKKQEISGTHCFNCGSKLLVDVPSARLMRDIEGLAKPPAPGSRSGKRLK